MRSVPTPCSGSSVLFRRIKEANVVKGRRTLAAYLLFGLLLIAVSRLPQLNSSILNVDGDEAIVALMAKNVSEGQSLPVYFQEQCYKLSLFGGAPGSLLFDHVGMLAITLKAAMLLLCGIGWIFFVLASNKFTDIKGRCIAGQSVNNRSV